MYGKNTDLPNQIRKLKEFSDEEKNFLIKELGFDSIEEIKPEKDYVYIGVVAVCCGGDAGDMRRLLEKIDRVKNLGDAAYYANVALQSIPGRATKNALHKRRN